MSMRSEKNQAVRICIDTRDQSRQDESYKGNTSTSNTPEALEMILSTTNDSLRACRFRKLLSVLIVYTK